MASMGGASLHQIYAQLQTRGGDGRFVPMGGALRRPNARRAPSSSPTGGSGGATPPLCRSAHLIARPCSPTSGGDGAKKTAMGTATLLLSKKKANGPSPSSTSGAKIFTANSRLFDLQDICLLREILQIFKLLFCNLVGPN